MASNNQPFEIVEVLGQGAFGAVCVARMANDPLKRLVAIKVLKKEYASSPKVLQRTRDEARMMSKLHHPYVVRVEQLIEFDGLPVLVMELVKGVSIKKILDRHPQGLPPAVALEMARRTCLAIYGAYHEATDEDGQPLRIIHRDIKPSNMLLSIHGQFKVADFGIATGQFSERESRTESLVMGSRPYMAPERLDGGMDTPAVDIYSAGMSLFEMLSGKTMNLSINPTSHDQAMTRQLSKLRLASLTRTQAESIRQLIRRMCAYDMDYRPGSREAAGELERILEGLSPESQMSLESFSSTVVQRLYDNRQPRSVSESLDSLEQGEALAAMFGPSPTTDTTSNRTNKIGSRPAIFFGVLATMLVFFGAEAYKKKRGEAAEPPPETTVQEHRVLVWFPSYTSATIAGNELAAPGHVYLPKGRESLTLSFEDGRVLDCEVNITREGGIRYVGSQVQGSVSVNDGPATPCVERVKPAAVSLAPEGEPPVTTDPQQ